jgi:hypothetical protein
MNMASAAITIWNTSHPLHPDKPWYESFSRLKNPLPAHAPLSTLEQPPAARSRRRIPA